jgi:hypothetical protein
LNPSSSPLSCFHFSVFEPFLQLDDWLQAEREIATVNRAKRNPEKKNI